jgi:conjugative transfer region protein (TIGR03750 family)
MVEELQTEVGKGAEAPLPDRINAEPIILNGMSHSEIMASGACFFTFFLLTGLLFSYFTGYYIIILMIWPLFGTVVSIWYASIYLQKKKLGKPDGYHIQYFKYRLAKIGFLKSESTGRDDFWSLGRTWD